jgi:hypothetical protein
MTMSNYDDLFAGAARQDAPKSEFKPASAFDKETWAAQKQAERAEVFALMDGASEAVISNSKDFQRYLDVQSRFDKYSAGNILLILTQKPDATQLRDFDSWKENGVSIKKSEKGVSILEPGDEYTREDGTTAVSYNVKKVFDISQTTAKPLPAPHPVNERELIKALMTNPPVPIVISNQLPDNVGANYDPQNLVINIRQGMDGASIIRSLTQELAHAETDGRDGKYSRGGSAFTAYCASYVICRKHDVDVGGYDFSKLPESYKEMDAQKARWELSKIRLTSGAILENISKSLSEQRTAQKKTQPER